MKTQHYILIVAAAIAAGTSALGQNIIDQTYGIGAGSFELGTFVNGGGDATGGGGTDYMGLAPSNTTITGWTVGGPGDGVDWLRNPYFGSADGVHALDLKHIQNSSIFTVIPTVPGAVYSLSFAAAGPDTPEFGPLDNVGAVSAGSLVDQQFRVPQISASLASQVFTNFSFQFTAAAQQTTISFRAVSNISPPGSTYGPAIDKVSVELVRPTLAIRVSQVELCWDTLTNSVYQLEYREALSTNGWLPLGSQILGTGSRFCTNDAILPGQPHRFYQLSVTNAP
jgi:hypothetical protein